MRRAKSMKKPEKFQTESDVCLMTSRRIHLSIIDSDVWRRRSRPEIGFGSITALFANLNDRSRTQFIMFRLSSHLAREIEWRFSFSDTGSPAGDNGIALPLFPFVSLSLAVVLLALSQIIIAAARARSPPSLRSSLLRFCHSHPRQRAAFFRRVAQSVRRTPRVFVTVRNILRDVTEPRIASMGERR